MQPKEEEEAAQSLRQHVPLKGSENLLPEPSDLVLTLPTRQTWEQ